MNNDLMLKLASEIEARPDLYDQRIGTSHTRDVNEQECPLCVAGNALRLNGQPLAGDDWTLCWTGPKGVFANAQALLGLSREQALALFTSTPSAARLAGEFPGVTATMLYAIDELAQWKLQGPGSPRITPRRDAAADSPDVPFDVFWHGRTDEGARKAWRQSAATVMAATLRLIVRQHLLRGKDGS